MTFNCDGQAYCEEGNTAVITVSFNGQKETLEAPDTPICVKKESIDSNTGKKCYRFQAFLKGVVTFEHFACGVNAYYQSDSSLINNGAWLVVDGVIQNGTYYYYWSGNHGGVNYSRTLEIVTDSNTRTGSSSGDCSNCNSDSVKVTIKDKNGNQLYQKTGKDPCNVLVSCNGCPSGQIKCDCDAYPGFCCISCSEIKGGIASATAMLRGINHG